VDGFRFDLASILTATSRGSPCQPSCALGHRNRPSAGRHQAYRRGMGCRRAYQVGSFIGDSWKEWNGRFRDDVRSFFKRGQGYGL